MSKELFVSSTPRQTKVALVENDQLAEIYFERENEYTLAGSIYKGRVTRVLPGMQSAFVDIGLERDAFLYVSDFFEIEDEDETFDAIPAAAAKPFEIKPQVSSQIPQEFHTEAGHGSDFPEDEPEPANLQGGGAGQSSESENPRRWRGRRRGRRGAGRGFSESKFAAPGGTPVEAAPVEMEEVEEANDGSVEPEQTSSPIILPGESIAKFNRNSATSETVTEEPSSEQRSDRGSSRDRDRGRRGRDRGRDRNERYSAPAERTQERTQEQEPDRELDVPYKPVQLPGESIAKFNRGKTAQETSLGVPEPQERAAAEEPISQESVAQEPVAVPKPRQRAVEEFRPYARVVLPGESIAKYRGPSRSAASEVAEAGASSAHHEESEEIGLPPIGLPLDVENSQQNLSDTKLERTEEVAPQQGRFTDSDDDDALPTFDSGVEGRQAIVGQGRSEITTSFPPLADEAEGEEEVEEIHTFADGHEPIIAVGHETEIETSETHDASGSFEASEAAADNIVFRPNYEAAPVGAFEEEEIDDEEDDLPQPIEMLDERFDFEELEEETLEPAEMRAAESEHESEDEPEFHGEFTGGHEDADEEDAEFAASTGADDSGRAELRGPSGTAGFQRATSPEYDRHRRGRRGGKKFRSRREQQRPTVAISDVLKEGQEILVQIAKEPIGKKGARITSHIALPGRFLVYMPTVNHTGVSRKISSEEERQRLKRIVTSERENGHGGFIVRTAASHVSEADLRADIRFLKSLWHDIKSRTENAKPPSLIYHDLSLVERTLRDLVTADFSAVWVDTEMEYERILRFVNRFQPSLVRRIKLYTKETPLFEQFGIEEEINKALKSKVWLKSGGYIVINQTEALVAIDINTGKYVGKTQRLEDTIFKTNVDAIKEIVRQIRLRDLGGIIVIDFIDMDERRNRQKVMQALEEELQSDRAPSKVLQFNDFGLVAITRKRVKQSLERTLGTPCPYCTANGFVKSPVTVCNEIFTEMKKMQNHLEGDSILLRVNPEVGKMLKSNEGRWLSDMEELTGKTILVKADATLHQEHFDL